MAEREVRKNARETIRVTPSQFKGHDLINLRVYTKMAGEAELVATKKGIAIPVDMVPSVIEALTWALGQKCAEAPGSQEVILTKSAAAELAEATHAKLRKHGSPVHWDIVERMVVSPGSSFTKWDLHYVLATRPDLFERVDDCCYRAV